MDDDSPAPKREKGEKWKAGLASGGRDPSRVQRDRKRRRKSAPGTSGAGKTTSQETKVWDRQLGKYINGERKFCEKFVICNSST